MHSEEKHWDAKLIRELREIYGDDAKPSVLRGRHHARHHRADTTYHIISRTLRGYCLMTPDRWFNLMAAGVIGRAQKLFSSIELYSYVFMASHLHMMLQGSPEQIPKFVGFIKREISRRLGERIDWKGAMWDGRYLSTALPTPEAEIRCMEYLLGHGVKEKLVSRSHHWPGLHAAKQLRNGSRVVGEWLDATRYGRAKYNAKRRGDRRGVDPKPFVENYEIVLHVLPAWRHLTDEQRLGEIRAMLDRIEQRAHEQRGPEQRGAAKVPGAQAVLNTDRLYRKPMRSPPWWEERTKMVCWADPRDQRTRDYVNEYWTFQFAYRKAADAFRAGDLEVSFPANSFSPPKFRPPPHAAARAA